MRARAILLCNGPSLRDLDWTWIKDADVVAISTAIRSVKPEVWVFVDPYRQGHKVYGEDGLRALQDPSILKVCVDHEAENIDGVNMIRVPKTVPREPINFRTGSLIFAIWWYYEEGCREFFIGGADGGYGYAHEDPEESSWPRHRKYNRRMNITIMPKAVKHFSDATFKYLGTSSMLSFCMEQAWPSSSALQR